MPQSVMWKFLTAAEPAGDRRPMPSSVLPWPPWSSTGRVSRSVSTPSLSEAVSRRAPEAIAADTPVVVAPTLWCGMAEHHMAFGGTFTFDIPTFGRAAVPAPEAWNGTASSRVLIVNGHGGNIAALSAFLPDIVRETGLPGVTTYFEQAKAGPGGGAGEPGGACVAPARPRRP